MAAKEEVSDLNVFHMPGSGIYFRVFLGIVVVICAIGLIVGGIMGGISLMTITNTTNKELMEILGVFVILLMPGSGLLAIYFAFIDKRTRFFYGDQLLRITTTRG